MVLLCHRITLSSLDVIFLERIIKLSMTIENNIRDEKLQHDINRDAAKIPTLLSSKIDKYEYLTGEEILRFNQS